MKQNSSLNKEKHAQNNYLPEISYGGRMPQTTKYMKLPNVSLMNGIKQKQKKEAILHLPHLHFFEFISNRQRVKDKGKLSMQTQQLLKSAN